MTAQDIVMIIAALTASVSAILSGLAAIQAAKAKAKAEEIRRDVSDLRDQAKTPTP